MCKKVSKIYYLEVLRAAATLAVVLLHVASDGWYGEIGSFSWNVFTVFIGLTRFCVPVFLMISGALFLQKDKELSVGRIYRKYIPRLLLFLAFWGMVYQIYIYAEERLSIDPENPVVFDAEYYYENNRDIANAIGYDEDKLREHFEKFGMAEGRAASAYFVLEVYKERNDDLREAFGDDNKKYYEHFIKDGMKEGRIPNNSDQSILLRSVMDVLAGKTYNHLWYVYAIIGLYILTPVFKVFTERADKKSVQYALAVLFVLSSLLPLIYEIKWVGISYLQANIRKMELSSFATYLGYYLLGHYLHTYEVPKISRCVIYILGVAGTLVSVLVTMYLCVSGQSINETYLAYNSLNVVAQSAAIYLYVRQKCTAEGRCAKVVSKLSKTSFGIYGVHMLFLLLLSDIGLNTLSLNPFLSVFIIFICVTLLSFVVTSLLQKIPGIRRVVS